MPTYLINLPNTEHRFAGMWMSEKEWQSTDNTCRAWSCGANNKAEAIKKFRETFNIGKHHILNAELLGHTLGETRFDN